MADNNIHSGHRARLREKFKKGKELFSEHELLELLLGYSIARKDTNELAHNLINRFGSLSKVLSASPETLLQVDGVGETTATMLTLIGYITALNKNEALKTIKLSNIAEVKKVAINLFEGFDHEVFYMLYLNGKREVLGYTILDDGNTSSVIMNFEKFSKDVLIYKPKSCVILHNHFAKYPYPSKDDDSATAKIITFLNFYKVTLLDHIIVSGNEVYSYFYDNRIQKLKDSLNSDLI